ncbi:Ribose import ATP-binding protein RbsA [archaeon HR06]|nr:Ribose import ATP-binding protein RbsA [archaeon HR06]
MMEDSLVYMKGISKSFGAIKALTKVDFNVKRQEVVGLVGDNGAGKSTLIKILSGVIPPDEGEIYIEGKKVKINSPQDARAFGIETVYQDLALVEEMSVWRNLFLNREITKRIGPFNFLKEKDMKRMADEIIKSFGIKLKNVNEPIKSLSGGERQAVAVSRTFYFGAKLLILDEPTAALSIKEAEKVLKSISIAKERGLSVIFITHNIYHVYPVADRFVVLNKGKKIADVPKSSTSIEELYELIKAE